MRDFPTLLREANAGMRYVGVRLDVDREHLPHAIPGHAGPYGRVGFFLEEVVKYTHPCAAAYIMDPAFFCPKGDAVEANGPELMRQIIAYIKRCTSAAVIVDGRYCGSAAANALQAKYALGYLGADAVTVSPLLGLEALEPFFACSSPDNNRGVFALCTSSTPGADQLLDLLMPSNQHLRDFVAKLADERWRSRCGLMVNGAASPVVAKLHEVAEVSPLLVDGDQVSPEQLACTIKGITKENPVSFLVASGAIVHASTDRDFAPVAGAAARELNDLVNDCVLASQPV